MSTRRTLMTTGLGGIQKRVGAGAGARFDGLRSEAPRAWGAHLARCCGRAQQEPEGPLPTLGQRLRELRLAAGLSQRELAARVGVSFPHISKIEADRERASTDLLERIAKEVKCDPDELV